MIAIYNAKGIKEWDQYTIDQNNISSIELMEQAAVSFCSFFTEKINNLDQQVHIFCGPGNNGGDGYAIARILRNQGFQITVFKVNPEFTQSPDCLTNEALIQQKSDINLIELSTATPVIEQLKGFNGIAIDAIFGSGLSTSLKGWYADLVNCINKQFTSIYAVDIPSGVFIDQDSVNGIQSDHCVSFQSLKPCMVHPEFGKFAKRTQIVDIGLSLDYSNEHDRHAWLLSENDLKDSFKLRRRFSHKGTYGHTLIIAGFNDKVGAGILAAGGSLRAGIGKLTIHTDKQAYLSTVNAFPETMLLTNLYLGHHNYDSIAIGPGIGTSSSSHEIVKSILKQSDTRLCFDADALNVIAEHNLQSQLPSNSVITPYPREFERLFGKYNNGFERLKAQQDYSKEFKLFIIYKDAYPIITCPEGTIYVSPFGNPGMSSGGSGDVLTGILSSLLAQTDTILEACISAVLLHGLSGDLAAKKYSEPAMKATDIIEAIPDILKRVYG